jgi:hypothetical protein
MEDLSMNPGAAYAYAKKAHFLYPLKFKRESEDLISSYTGFGDFTRTRTYSRLRHLNVSPLFRVAVLSLVFWGLVWAAGERNRLAAGHVVNGGKLSDTPQIWDRTAIDGLPATQGPEIEETQPLDTGRRATSLQTETRG